MMLSDDNRKMAVEMFGKLSDAVQALVLNNAVMLSDGSRFLGSGVLLYADAKTAYVATAKHNLWKRTDSQVRPAAAPSTVVPDFQKNVKIFYDPGSDQPPKLGTIPQSQAGITAIDAKVDQEDDWNYDVMVLKTDNADLLQHAQKTGYIQSNADAQRNLNNLKVRRGGTGARALDRQTFTLVQIGFGHAKDADLGTPQGWEDHPKQLQCRFPSANGKEPLALVYDIPDGAAKADWGNSPTYSDQVELAANPADSTGAGDSGGPLFAVEAGPNGTHVFLVGLTLGANLVPTLEGLEQPPSKTEITNNCSTYAEVLLKAYIGNILFEVHT